MRKAGRITSKVLDLVESAVSEGVSTKYLDTLAEAFIRDSGGKPSFLNYRPSGSKDLIPFPASLCVSINDEVVHGIPREDVILKRGDLVSVDCGVFYVGYHGDSARTFIVGDTTDECKKLIEVTKKCLALAIEQAVAGNRLHDISAAVQKYAESMNYGIVESMAGHGIGSSLHEEPAVPNIGKPKTGILLREGMTLAIEPMINMGRSGKIKIGKNGWTAYTVDGKPSAHFEHTVVVRKNKAEILTINLAKEEAIEVEGVIVESLGNAMFRVRMENNLEVIARVSGKIRINFIKILPGDRVKVQVSPYDLTKGRIVHRKT
ncbi:hypothetical protein CHS0354_023753 [Potamilus streckersoni]|uniref:Methionine aminopeptidase n=1 Tax=Potamilus streckersoni TaxID=2493646 RepID=A0AAE0RZ62_9BIVA|nr:hypothetical protein CHS0354_023753 [Potamilus streckersoni]